MVADARVFVRSGARDRIWAQLLDWGPTIRRGEWCEPFGELTLERARRWSSEHRVPVVFASLRSEVNQIWLVVFRQGKCVRELQYVGDHGWHVQAGRAQRFEHTTAVSALLDRSDLRAFPDGYVVLDAFLGGAIGPPSSHTEAVSKQRVALTIPAARELCAYADRSGFGVARVLEATWEVAKLRLYRRRNSDGTVCEPPLVRDPWPICGVSRPHVEPLPVSEDIDVMEVEMSEDVCNEVAFLATHLKVDAAALLGEGYELGRGSLTEQRDGDGARRVYALELADAPLGVSGPTPRKKGDAKKRETRSAVDAPPNYAPAPADPRLGDLVEGSEAQRKGNAEALGRLRAGSDLSLLLTAVSAPVNAGSEGTAVRKALYDAIAWHDEEQAFACLVEALHNETDDSVAEWVNGVLWRQEEGARRLADVMVSAYRSAPVDDRFAFRLVRAAKALDLELSTIAQRDDAPPLLKRRCNLLPAGRDQDLDQDEALDLLVGTVPADGSGVRYALDGWDPEMRSEPSDQVCERVRVRDGTRIQELCGSAEPRVRGHALELACALDLSIETPVPNQAATGELYLREAEPCPLPPAEVRTLQRGYAQRGLGGWVIVDSYWLLHPDGEMRALDRAGQQWSPGVFLGLAGQLYYVDIQRVDTRAKHARPTLAVVWTALHETSSEVVREQKWKGGADEILAFGEDLLINGGPGITRRNGAPQGKARWTAAGLRQPRILRSVGADHDEIYVDTEDGIARLDPGSGEVTWLSPELACSNMIDTVGRFDDLLVAVGHGVAFLADAATGQLRHTVVLPGGFHAHKVFVRDDGRVMLGDGTRFLHKDVHSGLVVSSDGTFEDGSQSIAQVEHALTVRGMECRATPRALWSASDPAVGLRFEDPVAEFGPDTPAGLILRVGEVWGCVKTEGVFPSR